MPGNGHSTWKLQPWGPPSAPYRSSGSRVVSSSLVATKRAWSIVNPVSRVRRPLAGILRSGCSRISNDASTSSSRRRALGLRGSPSTSLRRNTDDDRATAATISAISFASRRPSPSFAVPAITSCRSVSASAILFFLSLCCTTRREPCVGTNLTVLFLPSHRSRHFVRSCNGARARSRDPLPAPGHEGPRCARTWCRRVSLPGRACTRARLPLALLARLKAPQGVGGAGTTAGAGKYRRASWLHKPSSHEILSRN